MVLEILADAGCIAHDRDAGCLQRGARTHARQLQDLRRAHRASGEQGFAVCFGSPFLAAAGKLHAAAHWTVLALFDNQALHMATGHDGQVFASRDRLQKSLGRVQANAAILIDVEIGAAGIVAAIEISGLANTGLLRRVAECIEDWPRHALLFNPPFATGSVHGAAAAVIILDLGEQGQNLVPGPAVVAAQCRPTVIVLRLSAHINHAIDGRAATHDLATWVNQRTAVQACFRFGLVQPVGARIANTTQITDRDVNPHVIIPAASLDQQDIIAALCGQAIR